MKRKASERGSALVATLGLILTASMLTGSAILLSNTASFDIAAHIQRQRSFYICEGASTRIQWLIAAERNVYNSASEVLGETDYEEYETDRWLPDGIEHELDYHGTKLKVRITDAQSGWALNSTSATNMLNSIAANLEEDEPDQAELFELLIPKIMDYVDSDDDVSEDGFDTADYEAEDMAPLPRNASMLYREEFLYIPGFTKLFKPDSDGRLSSIMLFALSGQSNPQNTIKSSFFTASREMIKLQCNFEDDQVDTVLEARDLWFRNKSVLSEELDGDLYGTLTSNFLFIPSGYYTVSIKTAEKKPFIHRIFSYEVFDIAGPSDNIVYFLEWWNL